MAKRYFKTLEEGIAKYVECILSQPNGHGQNTLNGKDSVVWLKRIYDQFGDGDLNEDVNGKIDSAIKAERKRRVEAGAYESSRIR